VLTSVVYDDEALCEERHNDMFFGPYPKDILVTDQPLRLREEYTRQSTERDL
jgi:hypothetical protein